LHLSGKVAVVTGAARGIGETIARRLAVEGARVVIADRDAPEAAAVAAAIVSAEGNAEAIEVSIDDEESIARWAQSLEARYGRCDILVNNAAINDVTPLVKLDVVHFRYVQRVNLDGQLAVTLELLPLLRRAGGHAS
jgi:NAD(P)-dependent dehydrogenase (short-subunit alcohol dehydrogenase family)